MGSRRDRFVAVGLRTGTIYRVSDPFRVHYTVPWAIGVGTVVK